ncbi:MAG: hypothetical protein ACKO43_02015, partial [Alphaproteobacteria bacterium]
MRRLILFLLMMGLSGAVGAVAEKANAATSLLGLQGPPAYTPSPKVPPIVPVNMCDWKCSVVLISAPLCGTGHCVTDLKMLPGSREFYE